MNYLFKNHFLKNFKTSFSFSIFLFITKAHHPFRNQEHLKQQTNTENTKKQPEEIEDFVHKFSHNFLKNIIINGLFRNTKIINEGSSFVDFLSEQEILQNAVEILVVNNIREQNFKKGGLEFSKKIVSGVSNDESHLLENDLNYLIIKTLRDPEMKKETLDVFLWLMEQKEVKEVLIDLFSNAVKNENILKAFTNALKASFYDILMNRSTVNKMKIFSFNVLEMESSEEEGTIKKLLHLFNKRFSAQPKKTSAFDPDQEEIREFFFFS